VTSTGIVVVTASLAQPGSAQVYNTPVQPYQFEAFYDVALEKHVQMLAQLAHQEHLYLAFCGESSTYRFTQLVPHDEQQWQFLEHLVAQADKHWKPSRKIKATST
jgi:hypothetical protein